MRFDECGKADGKVLFLFPGTACDYQTNFASVLDKLAEKYHLVFVDLQAAWDELFKHMHPCNIAWDRIHPNQTGCMYIAKQFLKAVGADRC